VVVPGVVDYVVEFFKAGLCGSVGVSVVVLVLLFVVFA